MTTSAYIAFLTAVLIAAVALLVWRRKRKNAGGARSDSSSDASAPPVQGAKPQKIDDHPTSIALGPQDAPYVQVSRALRLPDYQTEELPVPSAVLRDLQSWLQHVPRLAGSGGLFAANRYVVEFSPEVTRALSNGSMELMRSSQGGYYAIAVTADGRRIVQTGMIQKTGFPDAAIPGLLWQAAAVVTAQRFLADINKQLGEIGEAVEHIKRYLQAERAGTVEAAYDRLTEVIAALNSGKWDLDDARRWVDMLDDIDWQCSKIVKAGLAQRQDFLREATVLDIGKYWVNKKAVEQAVQNADDFATHFRTCTSALYVRAVTANVRAALPVGRTVLAERLASCARDSRAVREINDQHFKLLSERILDTMSDKKVIFSRDKTKQQAQTKIVQASNAARDCIRDELDEVDRIIDTTERSRVSVDAIFEKGLILELEVGKDQSVQRIYRVV
jgi:hypothetical protein